MDHENDMTDQTTDQTQENDESAPQVSEELMVATQWQLMWWKFKRHKLAVGAGIVLLAMIVAAVFADVVSPYLPRQRHSGYVFAPPTRPRFVSEDGFQLRPFVYGLDREMDLATGRRVFEIDTDRRYELQLFVRGEPYRMWNLIEWDVHLFGTRDPDGKVFLLGTDSMGRDLFTQILFGARASISIALLGVLLSVTLGLIIGGVAGYFGGIVDSIVQRLSEVLMSFPSIPLWMALAAALPREWGPLEVYIGIVVILSVVGWTSLGRQIRSKILSVKTEDFVIAARVNGASTGRLLRVHLIPSVMSHIIASLSLSIPGMIIAETALSFIGIGLMRPVISWGVLLQQAQQIRALMFSPWLLTPGIFVVITVLAFNFVGDGLRDAADPYSSLV